LITTVNQTGKYWIVQEMCPLLKRVRNFKNIINNNSDSGSKIVVVVMMIR
jgi:hypothetical protein